MAVEPESLAVRAQRLWRRRRHYRGAGLVSLGGALNAVSTWLPAMRVTIFGHSASVSASNVKAIGSISLRQLLLPSGLALLVVGLFLAWSVTRVEWLGSAAKLLSLGELVLVVYCTFQLAHGPLGTPPGEFSIGPSWGLYAGIVGSAVAMAGAFGDFALRSRARRNAGPAPVRCARGHGVQPWYEKCDVCGAPIDLPPEARQPAPGSS